MLEDVNPVFIDLETRSCADLPEVGGWNYAAHKTTRLLTVSWSDKPDVFHIWFPGADEDKPIPADYLAAHLSDCVVHVGNEIPDALAELARSGRPWVAHNAWTFDQPVWEAVTHERFHPDVWMDTYPLALSVGLPGGLNDISKRLWGEGKYEAGSKALMGASRCPTPDLCEPCNVPVAIQCLVAKYNVQDVRLLRWLWEELVRTVATPQSELDVMFAHREINSRGVRIDKPLLTKLIELSAECQDRSVGTISELTDGFLASKTDLNSRNRVFKWLDSQGVTFGTSLRREVVQRFVEGAAKEVDAAEEDEAGDPEEKSAAVPVEVLKKVIKVLELRSCALRVTDGKLKAARLSLTEIRRDFEYRVTGMFVYHGAHTGRWTARRIQLHNLPKPKDAINNLLLCPWAKPVGVWALFDLYDRGRLSYDAVQAVLPNDKRFLTPDDAVSAMLRGILVPDDGKVLAAADFAAIECRVLARLAGEEWLLDAFWSGADPYIKTAEKVFGPWWTWPGIKEHVTVTANGLVFDKVVVNALLKKHPYRQVGKVIELGSGYGLGIDKFTLYAAASDIDLDAVDTDAKTCIEAYRDSHPAIAGRCAGDFNGRKYYRGGFWDRLNDGAISACATNKPIQVGRVTFYKRGGDLLCELPSGRCLTYRAARVVKRQFFGREIASVEYLSPRFGRTCMYGGKWAENVVQAVSRDVMAASIVRLERAGLPVCLHVHDEVGASVREDEVPRFMELVTECPDWLTDFPLDAEGGPSPRYAKSPPPGVTESVYRNGRFHK